MSQYRDLNQSATKKTNTVSKKMQELIDREKESYKTPPICEFCETPYNESKTEDCFRCKCMREGRAYATMDTLREQTSEETLQSYGLSKREE